MTAKFARGDVGPKYSFIMDWEENFDYDGAIKMLNTQWWIPVVLSIIVYLPTLKFLTIVMRNREPFKLRVPLIFWNIGLALFSVIGFCRLITELLHVLQYRGFHESMCNNSYKFSKPARFWIYLFTLSKIPELVDTVFLCLKKQQLIFLHVYHHASVLLFAWFALGNEIAAARWFATINLGIHSVMYSYYALKAMPNLIRIPKWVSMAITTSQTLQMVYGSYLCSATFYDYLKGGGCHTNVHMGLFSLLIYTSYLVLFSHFFYRAYLAPRPLKDDKATRNGPVKDRKQA